MKKETRHIAVIITGIVIALIGLISLQVYLLIVTYNEKEQAVDRNVINALSMVSQQLEKNEATSKIFNVALQIPSPPAAKKIRRAISKDSTSQPAVNGSFSWMITDTIHKGNGKQMRVEVFHSSGIDTLTTVRIDGKPRKKSLKQSFGYSYSTNENTVSFNSSVGDSTLLLFGDTTKKRRGEIVAQVVDKLFLVERLPIEQRLNLSVVDSLIKQSLFNVGVTMDYSFRVTAGDSIKLSKDTLVHNDQLGMPFKTRLFPNDVLSPRYELALFLPEKSSFVLKEMFMLLFLSVIFISIVVLSFIYTIRIIVLQKRFAVSIVDFINNMTHEFKTPISTIALASEAITKPEVLKSKVKLLKYNSLIADENIRMKNQVDKILQMAVLEEGEFELKRIDVNMQTVIEQAIKNVAIQVEQRNGKILSQFDAKEIIVNGDVVHLGNIIHNILDNAAKYSPTLPTITVITSNVNTKLSIVIKDNGIGIAKEDLERVFEKYYRVSTGNMHDVKGFGLGLSYVKLIVEAHGGTVSINSKRDEGTIVEIQLPVKH